MFKKAIALIPVLFLASAVFAQPKLTYHGVWYTYSFMWSNADFNSDVKDWDQHYYMHGDFTCDADFGAGIGTHVTFGDWGTFGKHAITCEGPEGCGAPPDFAANGGHLMEAYLTASNLFDTPISFRVGKEHVCYGDQVFDGGEDGFMGAKVSYNSDVFDLDIFSYRLVEGGGTGYIGAGDETIPDDWDLHGLWATGKLLEGKISVSPYGFYRTRDKDNPMWAGLRSDGSPVEGLNYAVEAATMLGKCENADTFDYKGMHYMGRVGYSVPNVPVTIGGAYVAFTGDDPATDENECYESPTWGPYTFGFYKDWPGFGPAHLMKTCCGFSLLAPWEPMVANLNVIDGNVGYTLDTGVGPLDIRADFFMYTRNTTLAEDDTTTPNIVENESAMGNEIALMLKYTYKETITFGVTGGYLMPGEYFKGEDAMLGGYIWTAMGF
jgi:hypothetical protein